MDICNFKHLNCAAHMLMEMSKNASNELCRDDSTTATIIPVAYKLNKSVFSLARSVYNFKRTNLDLDKAEMLMFLNRMIMD